RFAVQIYRWIDGFDLGSRIEQLPPLAVADLGRRLALGLAWLHRWNILHRDVRPKNIVLHAESARPMLIDFGLAKLEGTTMNTQVGDEFAAPEVRTRSPQWSKSAVVWSLATT